MPQLCRRRQTKRYSRRHEKDRRVRRIAHPPAVERASALPRGASTPARYYGIPYYLVASRARGCRGDVGDIFMAASRLTRARGCRRSWMVCACRTGSLHARAGLPSCDPTGQFAQSRSPHAQDVHTVNGHDRPTKGVGTIDPLRRVTSHSCTGRRVHRQREHQPSRPHPRLERPRPHTLAPTARSAPCAQRTATRNHPRTWAARNYPRPVYVVASWSPPHRTPSMTTPSPSAGATSAR